MLTDEQLELLESFHANGASVLSVYLDLDPARQLHRSYRAAFEDLVKAERARLNKAEREAFMVDVNRIQTWLDTRPAHGRGLAFFSCALQRLWQVHELPVRVDDHLAYELTPDVAPLLELVDDYERYAVALVDKLCARLFTVFLGAIEESETIEQHDATGKHREGGLSDASFQRHDTMHVHWHLKEVVMHLAALARHQPFDRLILAGSDDATDELRALLPRALAQRVVAVIGAEITASPSEILDKTLEVERKVEREVETRILEDLLENAGPNGRAIYGLEPTLDALYLNEVRTLVVADGVHVAGSECPVCARLEKGHVVTCPKCGAAMRDTHDVAHRAMLRVAELAGRVEVVHEAAARRLEVEGGGFGALLRYRSQVA